MFSVTGMSFYLSNQPNDNSIENVALELIFYVLVHAKVLLDLVGDWPVIEAVDLHVKFTSSQEQNAGPISMGFEYLTTRDLRDMTITKRTECAARYLFTPNVEECFELWLKISQTLFVLSTCCKYAQFSRDQSRRLNAIKRNIKNLSLGGSDGGSSGDKKIRGQLTFVRSFSFFFFLCILHVTSATIRNSSRFLLHRWSRKCSMKHSLMVRSKIAALLAGTLHHANNFVKRLTTMKLPRASI